MMKDIVIIANFCDDFTETDNGRFFYLAKMLAKDNEVEIITSDFLHITKEKRKNVISKLDFKISFIEEPGYKRNISLKRFYSHRKWAENVAEYMRNRKIPDVVYCAIPSLTIAVKAADYCNKTGAKFVIDIQDLWPEAFQMIVNVPILSNVGFFPFKKMADYAYKNADAICGVSETYVRRALDVNKKHPKTEVVYLGTDMDIFDKYADNNTGKRLSDEDNVMRLAYCGTLGSSYDLKSVFDAMNILSNKKYSLEFIIMGDGPKREQFEKDASKVNSKVTFTGMLPYDKMCRLLCRCDIVVNPIMHLAAQSIINKHADYAASGLPVVNTQENEEYKALVHEYKMGLNCKNSDANDLAKKIGILLENSELRLLMGKNARRCAEERFDRKETYKQLENCILMS